MHCLCSTRGLLFFCCKSLKFILVLALARICCLLMNIDPHLSNTCLNHWLKPGFHYRSWRPELTGFLITRQHGQSTRIVETGLKSRRASSQNYFNGLEKVYLQFQAVMSQPSKEIHHIHHLSVQLYQLVAPVLRPRSFSSNALRKAQKLPLL